VLGLRTENPILLEPIGSENDYPWAGSVIPPAYPSVPKGDRHSAIRIPPWTTRSHERMNLGRTISEERGGRIMSANLVARRRLLLVGVHGGPPLHL
jgi:hypothetical protein